ncbi:division/cell wall cluster transcriptional repressor MraZ [soil metagenome]
MGKAAGGVYLSTFEKQMDAKRRLVVPADFRAQTAGPFDGVMCFPSIEADCLEAGGQALFTQYQTLIEGLPFGGRLRSALQISVYGGQRTLGFDTAGRITLPDDLCAQFGLTDWVTVVGLGDRFQIWEREAFREHRARERLAAREGLQLLYSQGAPVPREAAA